MGETTDRTSQEKVSDEEKRIEKGNLWKDEE